MAAGQWATNGHMIADVARLGYLDGEVLDVTYGRGVFWKQWEPKRLFTNDLHVDSAGHGIGHHMWDFLTPPARRWLERFDSVVFDPPYKLNGTHYEVEDRYGVAEHCTNGDRIERLLIGAHHTSHLVKPGGYLLVKCQAQVAGGRVRWQPRLVANHLTEPGPNGPRFEQVDEFTFTYQPRPQPANRSQQHARRNLSTLLVFQRRRTP